MNDVNKCLNTKHSNKAVEGGPTMVIVTASFIVVALVVSHT